MGIGFALGLANGFEAWEKARREIQAELDKQGLKLNAKFGTRNVSIGEKDGNALIDFTTIGEAHKVYIELLPGKREAFNQLPARERNQFYLDIGGVTAHALFIDATQHLINKVSPSTKTKVESESLLRYERHQDSAHRENWRQAAWKVLTGEDTYPVTDYVNAIRGSI